MKEKPLKRVVTIIGASVATVIAVSLPLGYFSFSYVNLSRHLDFKAELNAAYLAKYINANPALWQFQRIRIAELLSQTDGSDTDIRKRVIDMSGKLVFVEGPALESPTILGRSQVVVAGTDVARVETDTSLRPVLLTTSLIAAFSAILAFLVFFALRIFPLRALDRTTEALERSNSMLVQTNERFDAALGNMCQGLCMFDAQGRILLFNKRYLQMFSLDGEAIKGKSLLDIFQLYHERGEFTGRPADLFAQVLGRAGTPGSVVMEMHDGRSIRVSDEPMGAGGWVSTFEDVTAQRAAQDKISHMALHDALTNLPNRLLFRDRIDEALVQLRPGHKVALLYFDLDRFKAVNDTLGHAFGDKLLQGVASRVRDCLANGDSLARIGGDEFAILRPQNETAEASGALAAQLIERVSVPFEIEGQQISVGVSVGIAFAPADAQDSDRLLKNADLALYRAKAEGKGVYRFFEPEMDRIIQLRRALEVDLRHAVSRGEFELHFQPLVDLRTERICAFEALIRWRHPKRGLVLPLEFIQVAEETALINPIGEWVIRQACEEATNWPDDVTIAVNLSPAQFKSRNLVQTVIGALAHSGLAAERLDLEITESVLLLDNEATVQTLRQLRELGVKISMDDFGTGYSSLSYLRSFPFDKIKIDRSFVHDLQINEDSRAIIRAVAGLGASLGMATIGEGVETQAEVDYLRGEGCTQAQGYFFGKAVPARDARRILVERNGVAPGIAVDRVSAA
jgi:diguanylate cyclase (GGDEF)-like protein